MDAYFEPNNLKYLSSRHSDIHNSNDVLQYLKAEYCEMLLFASKDVILSVKKFIEQPTREAFFQSILNMRQDLWAKKANLTLDEISFESTQKITKQTSSI